MNSVPVVVSDVLRFDNSYSILQSKRVSYNVEVLPPLEGPTPGPWSPPQAPGPLNKPPSETFSSLYSIQSRWGDSLIPTGEIMLDEPKGIKTVTLCDIHSSGCSGLCREKHGAVWRSHNKSWHNSCWLWGLLKPLSPIQFNFICTALNHNYSLKGPHRNISPQREGRKQKEVIILYIYILFSNYIIFSNYY